MEVYRSDFNFLGSLAHETVNHWVKKGSMVGLPVGIQVVGKRFQEEKVLAVMEMVQEALPTLVNPEQTFE